ncbi:MAG TPA: hypothetical protein PLJ08_11385 [Cyclobacteriaceae bacterium]|nr:hypothetical protein [Cyclobacteriaceae bacterium]
MSKITLSFLFVLVGYAALGQVGIGTNNPNPKSVLELNSPTNNQGFLVPRLTTAQRTAIAPTATDKGLLVFDTNTNKFHFWSGSAWITIDDATGTDSQTLSFTAPNLSISGGNSINLSGLNTDGQTLSFVPATGVLGISGGNSVTISGILPGGAAGGDLIGTYPNPTVTNNAINSAKILDASIVTADLADGSVNTNKIVDGTITNTDINAAAGIVVSKLGAGTNGQVLVTTLGIPTWTTPSFSPTGVAGGDLTGSYPNPSVANNTITSAKIVDGTITSTDILDATIATTDLANGAVTDAKIANMAPSKILQGGASNNQVLKWNGTAWAPAADNTGSGVSGSGSGNQVTFWAGTSNVTGNSNFVWDDKDGRLGVNTSTPRGNLHVNGSQFASTTILPATTNFYEIKPTDYIVIAAPTSTSKPMDVILPFSNSNLGMILIIRTFGTNASSGARVSLSDPKDRLDLIESGSYFLIYNNEANTYSYCITVVATEVGWVTIGRDRNGITN